MPKTTEKKEKYIKAIGRRKSATASVYLKKGKGEVVINQKPWAEYFSDSPEAFSIFMEPLELCDLRNKYDLSVVVSGGGKKAQIEAIRMAVSRTLLTVSDQYRTTLKKAGFLTRDAREKERKKPGLKRARRAPQWAKR